MLMGLGVVILMATEKIIWSIQDTGESCKSILIPAVIILLLCWGLIYYGLKKNKKTKRKEHV